MEGRHGTGRTWLGLLLHSLLAGWLCWRCRPKCGARPATTTLAPGLQCTITASQQPLHSCPVRQTHKHTGSGTPLPTHRLRRGSARQRHRLGQCGCLLLIRLAACAAAALGCLLLRAHLQPRLEGGQEEGAAGEAAEVTACTAPVAAALLRVQQRGQQQSPPARSRPTAPHPRPNRNLPCAAAQSRDP